MGFRSLCRQALPNPEPQKLGLTACGRRGMYSGAWGLGLKGLGFMGLWVQECQAQSFGFRN